MTTTEKTTHIINFISGPGAGKTTLSALLFAKLKIEGYTCEYVQEYAKTLVWTKDFDTLNNQYLVSKHQSELLNQINGKVDFIITDGPLIHGVYYNKYNKDNICNIEKTEQFILDNFRCFNNINIVLKRSDRPYEQQGRIQTEEESRDIDAILRHIMRINGIPFQEFAGDETAIEDMIEFVKQTKTVPDNKDT